MPDSLTELRLRLGEISDLGRARALLAWDERTMMPPGGAAARADQLATLARVRHERLAGDELGRLLDDLGPLAASEPVESDLASLVRVSRRHWEQARRVPAELRAEITRQASLGEHAWIAAREGADFGAFLPHLEGMLELKRRYAECFDAEHPYDPLLDDFEPGMTTAELRPVLEALRDGLRPLIAAIGRSGVEVDAACLYGDFPLERQRRLMHDVVAGLPIEPGEWRLDTTVHPFATAIAPADVRLTTRYDRAYLGMALWSVIHEAGHGIHDNGIPPELSRTPLCGAASLGFHESQSRLWENWVGRGRPYLRHLRPLLAEAFPERFGQIDAERLYRAANRVEPSLIRVEADEVTYNLHIVLRFELETELFEGRLAARELPEAWNSRMSSYLGIEVPDAGSGVLQDVHWAAGSFGYFPTYALGNVIAGQLWEVARAELPDLDGRIETGDMTPLRDLLRARVHRHGAKFMPTDLLERLFGRGLDPGPLLRQLAAKYGELYELGEPDEPAPAEAPA